VCQSISHFFKDIDEVKDKFHYLFTSYINRPNEDTPISDQERLNIQTGLRTEIFNAYDALNEDDRADTKYESLFSHLKTKINEPKEIQLIDVFDRQHRKNILETLLDSTAIGNPEDYFAMEISEKSKLSLKHFYSVQKHILKEMVIN